MRWPALCLKVHTCAPGRQWWDNFRSGNQRLGSEQRGPERENAPECGGTGLQSQHSARLKQDDLKFEPSLSSLMTIIPIIWQVTENFSLLFFIPEKIPEQMEIKSPFWESSLLVSHLVRILCRTLVQFSVGPASLELGLPCHKP